MQKKAAVIFFVLSVFLLATVFFVLQPTNIPELKTWQTGIKQQFSVAWQQTIGDQPYLDNLALIYRGVSDFYGQSSEQTISLFSQPETDRDLVFVYSQVYQKFAGVFASKPITVHNVGVPSEVAIPDNFMTEEPLNNIIPDSQVTRIVNHESIAGAVTEQAQPVNSYSQPWVTIQDAVTGQVYCLSVYNGDVNKYLGECKKDNYR